LTETFNKVGGGSFTLSAPALASYLANSGGGQYCIVTASGGDNGEATMGDTFMRGFVTVIDRVNGQVGFAPTSHCAAPMIAGPDNAITHKPRELGRGPHHHGH
jgi:hypothetical protein